MKMQKLNKAATPGPLRYENGEARIVAPDIQEDNGDGTTRPRRIVNLIGAMGGDDTTADAAKLAHCYTHFDELLKAFKAHVEAQQAAGLSLDCIVGGELIAECEEVQGI